MCFVGVVLDLYFDLLFVFVVLDCFVALGSLLVC